MQQSMKLLQMSTIELDEYLQNLTLENPMLDCMAPAEQAVRPLSTVAPSFRSHPNQQEGMDPERMKTGSLYETFSEQLKEQAAALKIPELMRREVYWLIGELDERGYLPPIDEDAMERFQWDRNRYENAVKVLQAMEPAGVGARNLSECLELQLRRMGKETKNLIELCRNWLPQLARGQYGMIAKQTGISKPEILELKEEISSLTPNPANGYAGGRTAATILPDVEIYSENGTLQVALADRYMPTYQLNTFYLNMAENENLEEEEREYFKTKLSQARWVIQCVSKRNEFLLMCAEAIAREQTAFFQGQSNYILPITMTQLADQLDVSPSTISRAVNEKYISCCHGTFPMSYFFSTAVNKEVDASKSEVISVLQELIEMESKEKPYSDQQLAEQLTQRGFSISRRTVAKYRGEFSIPSATMRRKH